MSPCCSISILISDVVDGVNLKLASDKKKMINTRYDHVEIISGSNNKIHQLTLLSGPM